MYKRQVYDWADRATDTYGPAPAACFDQTGRPVVTPPPGVVCGVIPHTHTGFDTDSTGQRVTGLSLDQYDNLNLSGQPMKRTTTASVSYTHLDVYKRQRHRR